LTDSYTSASFADKNVGSGKTVSVSGISVTGTDAGNYTFNITATTLANITARPLTVTATGTSRTYDGTTAAAVTLSDNRISGDLVTDNFTSASFSDKNAGTGKTITVTGISLSGPDAGNYSLASTTTTTTADITPMHLTVNAVSDNKVYDATTSSSQTPSITVGSIAPGDSGNFTQAFDSKNAGARTLIATGSVADGNGGNNYVVIFVSATGSITQRPLTISATGNNKIYDGTTVATVTLSDNHLAGDSVTDSYVSAAFNDKNVGTGKPVSVTGLSIAGPDAPNYIANSSASTTANIAPRALTVSASGVSKVYDGTPSATVTLSDDRVTGDLLTDNYTSASFADKNVGNGKPISVTGITISGPDAGNYTANSSTSTTANITPLAIVGSITAANKVYDGTTAASIASRTLAGVLGSDAVTYTGGTASFADKNVGVGKLVTATGLFLSGGDAGNYTVNSTATATANISPLAITVTAAAETKVYGTADPVLNYTSNPPLVGGDTFSGVLTRVAGENVGSYSIQQGSLSAGSNYTMTFIGAQLTITKASSAAVIISSAPSVELGQSVTFTATVTDASAGSTGTPTGNVQFYVDGAVFGSPLALNASGAASISTSTLSASAGHTVYAVYLGDGNFFGSTSATITVATLYLPAGTACLGSPGHQILQPVNADGSSTFKQGSTVPAKFRVCDINGNSIGTAGVVQSFVLVGVKTGTVMQSVDETVDSTTPDTAFRWDATSQQWIFNISTKTMGVNSTYFFQIKLNDGSIIPFSFGLPR
jgi:hypothetical protein